MTQIEECEAQLKRFDEMEKKGEYICGLGKMWQSMVKKQLEKLKKEENA